MKKLNMFVSISCLFLPLWSICEAQINKNVYISDSFIIEEYPTKREDLYATLDYSKKREKWRGLPYKDGLVDSINKKIIPLSYKLVQREESPVYDFLKKQKLIEAGLYDITNFSIDKQNPNFVFFAKQRSEKTVFGVYVKNDHIQKMKEYSELYMSYFFHGFYPFFVNTDLTWCEVIEKGDTIRGVNLAHWEGFVKNSKEILYKFSFEYGAGGMPVHFREIGGSWILEIDDGRVILNGENLCKKYNYSGMWQYRSLKGKPFFFFTHKGDKKFRISYDGKEIPRLWYDFVGDNGGWTVFGNDVMVWFGAMRDKQLYYVEAGIYE